MSEQRNLGAIGAGAGLIAGTAAGYAIGSAMRPKGKAPIPAKIVDAQKLFNGRWAELARRPSLLTNNCVAGAANYRLVDERTIEVRDTCQIERPDGRQRAMAGKGEILDPDTNTQYRVRYRLFGFLPLTLEFWVLDRADDYAWFIASDPAFHNLWIFARDPRLEPGKLNQLIKRAQELGYDTTKLEYPEQP